MRASSLLVTLATAVNAIASGNETPDTSVASSSGICEVEKDVKGDIPRSINPESVDNLCKTVLEGKIPWPETLKGYMFHDSGSEKMVNLVMTPEGYYKGEHIDSAQYVSDQFSVQGKTFIFYKDNAQLRATAIDGYERINSVNDVETRLSNLCINDSNMIIFSTQCPSVYWKLDLVSFNILSKLQSTCSTLSINYSNTNLHAKRAIEGELALRRIMGTYIILVGLQLLGLPIFQTLNVGNVFVGVGMLFMGIIFIIFG